MTDFAGKVILIAGAIGTTGAGIAENFRSKGAMVLIAPGQLLPPDLMALYADCIFIGHVSDPADLAHRYDEIAARHGRLDLVIFCSGSNLPQRKEEIPATASSRKALTLLGRLHAMVISIV